MNKLVDNLTKILKGLNGELNLKDDVYYLFLKDGLFSIYYDEDEKTIKVDIEFFPEEKIHVRFSDIKLSDLMEEK